MVNMGPNLPIFTEKESKAQAFATVGSNIQERSARKSKNRMQITEFPGRLSQHERVLRVI